MPANSRWDLIQRLKGQSLFWWFTGQWCDKEDSNSEQAAPSDFHRSPAPKVRFCGHKSASDDDAKTPVNEVVEIAGHRILLGTN